MGESARLIESNQRYGATEQRNDNGNVDPLKEAEEPPKEPHSLLGIFFIMVGAFSFSVMFLLVKLMEGTADSFTLVFYRSLVQIAIALGSIIRNGEHPLGGGNWVTKVWLLIRGGFGAGAVIAWFFGVQNLPLPDAVTLQFTTPAFSAAFAVCFAGEKWMKLDMVGAIVCLMGVALIAHPTWLFGNQGTVADETDDGGDALMKAIAVAVTTGGAGLAGMAYVSVRLIGDKASANVMVLYYGALSIPIVLFGSKMLLGKWSVWGEAYFSVKDYFLLLLTGFAGYGGQLFTNIGLQKETAATGTLATSTQIVWTYIFELTFLHEGINSWSVAGTGLILGFMLVVGQMKMKEANSAIHESIAGEMEEQGMLYASERDVNQPPPPADKEDVY